MELNDYAKKQYDKMIDFLIEENDIINPTSLSIRPVKQNYRCLVLPLKRKWFEMIRNGIKLEEYRNFDTYWHRRLYNKDDSPKMYDYVIFTLGYPNDEDLSRILIRKYNMFDIGCGRMEWGAPDDIVYKIFFDYRLNSQLSA